jgi:hypothetical protein
MTNLLAHAGGGLTWATELFQVLVLDRLSPSRRQGAMRVSAACRTLKIHSRSPILSLEWPDLLAKLGSDASAPVSLPDALTQSRSVGDANYYYALSVLVNALRPSTILEIGTYLGVGTYCMAMNAPADCRIFTVDLPDEVTAETKHQLNHVDERHITRSRHRVGEAFLRSDCEKKITQIRADSLTFRAEQLLSPMDFVFIDGGHSLPCVAADTENALRVISPTGIILWDDYFHLYPDVVRFLDNLSYKIPLFRIAGTNLVVHSRKWTGLENVTETIELKKLARN